MENDHTEDTGTPIDSTTETSTEGGDSLNADAGSETESVTPDSLAGGEDNASRNEPGPIPYSRFKESNDEKNDLRKQVAAYQERELLRLQEQARGGQGQSQEPIFDEDTTGRLNDFWEQKRAQDPDILAAQKMGKDWKEFQLRQKNADYDQLEPEVKALRERMSRGEISDMDAEQIVLDAMRYRSGAPQRDAAQEALDRQSAKRKASGPSGVNAQHTSEGINLDDKNLDLDQLISDVKTGQGLNWD